jgi:hypothetical protein
MPVMDERFRRVSTGLTLVCASQILLVQPIVLFIPGAFHAIFSRGVDFRSMREPLAWCIMGQAQAIIALVGAIYCLRVPEKVEAARAISTAVGLAAASMAISLAVSHMIRLGIVDARIPGWVFYVAELNLWLWLAGNIVFVGFLVRLADFLGISELSRKARFVLHGSLVASVLLIALRFCMIAVNLGLFLLGFGVLLLLPVVVVFWLVLLVQFLMLVYQLWQTLERQLYCQTID